MHPPLHICDFLSLPMLLPQIHCTLCPRCCGADHSTPGNGFCAPSDPLSVAAVVIHKGEEPLLGGDTGVCNLFFSHCNLQCLFCQNRAISDNQSRFLSPFKDLDAVVARIKTLLPMARNRLGFVSPSHCVAQVIAIVSRLREEGIRPITLYNSNGYDSVSSLQLLAPYIDIYLPDFKYSDPELARVCSGRADYPAVALNAIREMYRQKGSSLLLDEEERAFSGILVRHLVLPGFPENTKGVLQTLAQEISTGISLSLMAQYHPPGGPMPYPSLMRTLTTAEYEAAREIFYAEGFYKGFFQDISSHQTYLPSFGEEEPFA